ncbi:MAG TPA: ATP-binding cassette domain-containing protein, partial [Cellvibrionaceae bacterium]|nr:ATP-binding cassette domain-containing protein [Cellvibrionaceae bacterium]
MLEAKQINLYYGASQALQQVNVIAKKGEITCILGRNGVGKTSIARAFGNLVLSQNM